MSSSLIKQFSCQLFDQWFKRKLLLHTLKCKYCSSEHSEFLEQSVQIKTCGNLYRKWKEQKLFSKVPDGDLTFKVPFIDTRPGLSETINSASPTILALHGAPGSWRDFRLLSSYLHYRGCRVIVPSFPDFSTYKPGIFRHSDEEKAQFIKDFLAAISVLHVDLLISHSGATWPALNLCLDEETKIKSLCLLNPGPFNVKEMRATRGLGLMTFKILVKASENSAILKLIEICGPFLIRLIFRSPIRCENIWDPILSATTVVHGHMAECKEKYQKLSQKLPILCIFSENDVLFSTKPSYEVAECLGATYSDVFIYDSKEKLVKQGTETPMLKVLAIQRGSHYVFLKHPELVNRQIADFLNLSEH